MTNPKVFLALTSLSPIMSRLVVYGEDHVPRTIQRPRSLDESTSTSLAKNQRSFARSTYCWTDQDTSQNGSASIIRGQPKRSDFPRRNDVARWLEARFGLVPSIHGEQRKNRIAYSEYQQSEILDNRQRSADTAKWDERGKSKLFDTPHSALSRLRPLRIDRPSQSVDSSQGSPTVIPVNKTHCASTSDPERRRWYQLAMQVPVAHLPVGLGGHDQCR